MTRKKAPSANKLLHRLRVDEKNWTKEQLARKAEVSAQTVRNAERGISISEVSMAKIAKALGSTADKLFSTREAV